MDQSPGVDARDCRCGCLAFRHGLRRGTVHILRAIIPAGHLLGDQSVGMRLRNGFRFCFSGLEHLHHLSRYGPAAKSRELGGAFVLIMTSLAARLGHLESARARYLLTQQSKFHSLGEFWTIFIPSLTAMIGFWLRCR